MRYTPNPDPVVREMLQKMGLASLDDLFVDIPESLREKCVLPEGAGLSEMALRRQMEQLALDNVCSEDCPVFLGAGCYDHYIPAAVSHLLARSEFYTTYTPYQPEISQGILQSIFEYQSLICNLTGLPVSNASMYCGGSALALACQLAAETTGRRRILLPTTLLPDWARIVETYAQSDKMEVDYIPCPSGIITVEALESLLGDDVGAVVLPYPNYYGILEEVGELVATIRKTKALAIMTVDPIAMALLKSPGEWGVDMAVGDGQPLGNPMSFGGPHLGFMAVTDKLLRKIPGRLVGETVDSRGQRAFVLTLQAREQHIRREKALSNICSNEALCALAACMYLTFLGPLGLKQAALNSHRLAWYAHEELAAAGFRFPYHQPFFREFAVAVDRPHDMNEYLLENGIIGGLELDGALLLAFTEKRTREEVDELVYHMKEFEDRRCPTGKETLA